MLQQAANIQNCVTWSPRAGILNRWGMAGGQVGNDCCLRFRRKPTIVNGISEISDVMRVFLTRDITRMLRVPVIGIYYGQVYWPFVRHRGEWLRRRNLNYPVLLYSSINLFCKLLSENARSRFVAFALRCITSFQQVHIPRGEQLPSCEFGA